MEATFCTGDQAVRDLRATFRDGGSQIVSANARLARDKQPAVPAALDLTRDKIIKVEIKTKRPSPKDLLRICGIRVTTAANKTWTVNQDFDPVKADEAPIEMPPMESWELKGFYGACADRNVIRNGCIWGD